MAVGLREMQSTGIKLRTGKLNFWFQGFEQKKKKKKNFQSYLALAQHPYNHALVCTYKTLLHCTDLRKDKILLHENMKTISSLFSIKIYFSLLLFCFALVQKKILMKEFSHPKVMFQIVLS